MRSTETALPGAAVLGDITGEVNNLLRGEEGGGGGDGALNKKERALDDFVRHDRNVFDEVVGAENVVEQARAREARLHRLMVQRLKKRRWGGCHLGGGVNGKHNGKVYKSRFHYFSKSVPSAVKSGDEYEYAYVC